tara:strand:+ start:514 stop:969 length:456 start_codon:yes stop_codon:yes gene_type:complete
MNSCGECTFCCEVLPFTHEASWADTYNERYKYDIIYPPGRACNKVCSTGCSIHQNKPKICREFNCDYILLELEEKFKPNKCGFVCRLWKKHQDNIITLEDEIWIHFKGKEKTPKEFYDANKSAVDEVIEIIREKYGWHPVRIHNEIETFLL